VTSRAVPCIAIIANTEPLWLKNGDIGPLKFMHGSAKNGTLLCHYSGPLVQYVAFLLRFVDYVQTYANYQLNIQFDRLNTLIM